ncbi:helix-turn-helix domain-containing protein [Cellulosilyticum sp. I15G10I2]|uniref:helix-turn-helix domain-containing protein n=1 Tax=Cellulosilyticum sp. I15G10I2 TaxID=1892843 RepID=UPI001FA71EBF|nr:AraC family transcriptional regulator [Cellulosilyticum sp. I15G10I2]
MSKKKQIVEFRYYEIPNNEMVLALLGEAWRRAYGVGIDTLHFHNFIEIGYCHEGTGEVIVDNQSFRFEPNMFTIIPPNLSHTTYSDKGTEGYWEWMYFDIEKYLNNTYKDDAAFIQKLLTQIYRKALLLHAKDHIVLDNILRNIIREMQTKDTYYQESVKGYMQAFIVELLRLDDHEEKAKRTKQKAVQISAALDYVGENYREEIKISQLADACNMSESHFRRLFLESMNMKPVDYINLIRVQKACELIKKSQISMEDVAYKVGFTTVSTFNRNFKNLVGTSPYQWKQSAENFEGKLLNYKISAQKGW